MADIPANSVHKTDCLTLLERLQSEQATLAYLDPPWYPDADFMGENELREHLLFLSRVLQQVHRVLSKSGTLFFHSSPYFPGNAKLMLDQIFDRDHFVTEIIWPRSRFSLRSPSPATQHETIYIYSKTDSYIYNPQPRQVPEEELQRIYNYEDDEHRRFKLASLTTSFSRPSHQFMWRGVDPPANRSWRYSRPMLDQLDEEGRIFYSGEGVVPRLKLYLDEGTSRAGGSVWDDIPSRIPTFEDRHFQTQKPLALMERIVRIGSNPGDLVLDPFCGSGTALIAAQANNRQWIGCDLSPDAYSLTLRRLKDTFGSQPGTDFAVSEQGSLVENHRVIDRSYRRITTVLDLADSRTSPPQKFVRGESVPVEETRYYEFKEVKYSTPVSSIKNKADKYVVAFLNSEGGHIYWGISDSGRVVGVELADEDKDHLSSTLYIQVA